ncbi:related to UTP22 - U3 snoRNP protein involved in maturation of pre-18S rRNA [Cephalotrichum gorgonifer]|uniref:U3 small nucleolar RNA-associated protein 22 n=1 Tax=Cephalotrichum gorgonifer TaxID=2041049 RepID=A0AAE8SUT8_9PEZI|nr:related to UTP22 - U3 snoRNP protein involved in maturation of pre-18S rRNA [Cephalotrichum gorgonifer]
MESSAKRRKTSQDAKHETPTDMRVATASRFVLEAEELLKEVRVDYSKASFGGEGDVDSVVFRLREAIEAIEGHEGVPIWEATKRLEKKKIKVPYPDPRPAPDAQYKLAYSKPSQYNVVGSYVSQTMVKSQSRFAVDMVVEMPKELFQEKDYQNLRYFYRRAYYLAYVAVGLKAKVGGEMEMEFEYLGDNHFLPVLVLRPKATQAKPANGEEAAKDGKPKGSKSKFVVRIIPCAPTDLFPKTKLLPSCNCNKKSAAPTADQTKDSPTPFYNSTVKAEETFIPYLKVLTHAKNECPAFAEACLLGRTWLQQRGFSGPVSKGGFGHFEWSVMVALLLQTGRRSGGPALSSSLGSTELFKAAVQFIASTDFVKKPFLFGDYTPGADAVRESAPVMFDPARELNIVYKMTPWSASLLRVHAKSTLESLGNPLLDQFEPTFIAKADLPLQIFDSISELKITRGGASEAVTGDQGFARGRSSEVYRVLKKAFGNRARLVHIQWGPSSPWETTSAPTTEEASTLRIGVTFDPIHMARQMELGPPAEEPKEAAKFRSFWGEKAELRRFKDGSILECVPWDSTSQFDLCQEIMQYILEHQLKIDPSNLVVEDTELPSIIPLTPTDRVAFDATMEAFRLFERDIRNLEGMPLQVRRMSPVAAGLRYSSIRTPASSLQAGVLQPLDVLLFFETSNKWPENIVAIQQTKIEFLLDIDRRLNEANDNVKSYLGREDVELGFSNLAFLDVVYDNGAAFRVRIHSDMEETLLMRQTKNITLDQHVRAETERALLDFNWQYELLPRHSQTISTICSRLPALSPTIRLTKYWFNSQKLSGHFSEELIEILVLYVFLQPHPFRMPSSVSTGFMQVLLFLARWDWRDEPLIVDFDGEDIPAAERNGMHKQLEEWRRRDANMKNHVLFVATTHDRSGTAYTRTGPSRMAAMRMTGIAKAAAALMKERGSRLGADAKNLFETSLGVYDVVIYLSKKEVKNVVRDSSTESGARHSKFKNLDERAGRIPLPVARHPLTVLVDVLRDVYEDTLVFYHGGPDDMTIGAVWVPRAEKQNFRVGLPFNFKGVAEEDGTGGNMVGVNRQAVLAEIARIGGSLIKRIEGR